jgi:putative peptidoglycan lipid II flippase
MSNPGVMRASLVMASGTVVSRILGFVKAIFLALAIGVTASAGADAFALGNLLPNTVYVILIGGVLNAVLVPQIIKATKHGDGGAGYINKLLTLASVILFGITALAMLLAPALVWIYATQWSPEQLALATAFAYWCLPQIFFYGLYTVLGEVLNARKVFGPYTWAPVLNNVVAIAGLITYIVIFGFDPNGLQGVSGWTPQAIALLAGSATLGVASQALILFVSWRRAGIRFRPDFSWRGVGLRDTGKIASWSLGMLIVMQVGGVVTNNIASLASGVGVSIAALQYAWLIFMLPHSVLAVSIGTAYFTRLSERANAGDTEGMRADFSASVRAVSSVMVLAASILFVTAPFISRVMVGGASLKDTQSLAILLMIYVTCLAPYSFLFVVQRGFFALNDTRTPFFFTLFQITLVVIGSLACIALPLELIGFGLAAVFSIATIVQTVLATWLYKRKVGAIDGPRVTRSVVKFLVAAVFTIGIGFALLNLSSNIWPSPSVFSSAGLLLVFGAIMALVYAVSLRLMRSTELKDLTDMIRSRLVRSSR